MRANVGAQTACRVVHEVARASRRPGLRNQAARGAPYIRCSRGQVPGKALSVPGVLEKRVTEKYVVAAVSRQKNGSGLLDRLRHPEHRLGRRTTERLSEGFGHFIQRKSRIRHADDF